MTSGHSFIFSPFCDEKATSFSLASRSCKAKIAPSHKGLIKDFSPPNFYWILLFVLECAAGESGELDSPGVTNDVAPTFSYQHFVLCGNLLSYFPHFPLSHSSDLRFFQNANYKNAVSLCVRVCTRVCPCEGRFIEARAESDFHHQFGKDICWFLCWVPGGPCASELVITVSDYFLFWRPWLENILCYQQGSL